MGGSDAGKSSIIRGLRFACLNHHSPGYIRSADTKATRGVVGVEFASDSHSNRTTASITRTKGKGQNTYTVNGKRLHAIGNRIPPEVYEIAKLVPENFQTQLEPHFWITKPAGQLSKELNRIVDLDIIDKSLKRINDRLREKKIETRICQDRISEAKKELEELQWFKEFERDAEQLLELEKRYGIECDKINRMGRTVEKCHSARLGADRANKAILGALKAVQIGRTLKKLQKQIKELEKTTKGITKTDEITKNTPDMTELKKARNKGDQWANDRMKLEELIKRIEIRRKLQFVSEKEIREYRTQLKSMKKVCPTCKRPM